MNRRFNLLLKVLVVAAFIQNVSALEQGDSIPDCSLKLFNESKAFDLKQLKGKVVYLDFWASWCAPCAKSFPFLNTLHTDLNDKGVEIAAVNLDENPNDAKEFLEKYPANFPIITDNLAQCAEQFGVKAMPSSYLIDRKGVIRHIHLGFKPSDTDDLKRLLATLISEK